MARERSLGLPSAGQGRPALPKEGSKKKGRVFPFSASYPKASGRVGRPRPARAPTRSKLRRVGSTAPKFGVLAVLTFFGLDSAGAVARDVLPYQGRKRRVLPMLRCVEMGMALGNGRAMSGCILGHLESQVCGRFAFGHVHCATIQGLAC